MLTRILTGNKNYGDVKKLVRQHFASFTIINAEGCWHGRSEHTLIIEILITEPENQKIEKLAYAIKKLNQQNAVLVQYIESRSRLI
jgi:hypothetical protein